MLLGWHHGGKRQGTVVMLVHMMRKQAMIESPRLKLNICLAKHSQGISQIFDKYLQFFYKSIVDNE